VAVLVAIDTLLVLLFCVAGLRFRAAGRGVAAVGPS
jgi:hypothetical protein